MNALTSDRQAAVIRALVEGNSLRSTARLTGVARNTVSNLLRDLGAHCKNHHDRFVRGIAPERVQMDEIWSFCEMKEKNVKPERKGTGPGDVWTWVALDPDTKLVIGYKCGNRDMETGQEFVNDVAGRITARVQITSDGLPVYKRAIVNRFGGRGSAMGTDYAQLVKVFGGTNEPDGARRYSPAKLIRVEKHVVMGSPAPEHISTSMVERQNLHMRMSMRRFTRLTNAFSKKLEFHLYAIALHYTYSNYCRVHSTLTRAAGKPTTPAMAAGLADKVWSIDDLLSLLQGN
jgi:IS1 family transposase